MSRSERSWRVLRVVGVLSGFSAPALFPGLSLAAEAAAAGGGKDVAVTDFSLVTFISSVLVFAAAYLILAKLAWPRIVGALDERAEKIKSEITSAEEARARADAALKEYEKSLAEARAESQRMLDETKAQQARYAAELRQQAEAEAQQLKRSAMDQIEAAKRAALSEIYAETAALATRVAERILQREVSEEDQRRLIDESVSEFTAEHNGRQPAGA